MQWLYPAGAWALLSLAVITALYLLKRQSVQKTAPSLLLWQKAAADQTASRPFQKLKKNILYFLQLLLALLLTAALMRPAVSGGVTGETVLIFDLSASMQAQANGESRLDEAKKKALSLVDGLHDGERVTVLARRAGAPVRYPQRRNASCARGHRGSDSAERLRRSGRGGIAGARHGTRYPRAEHHRIFRYL